RTYIDSRDFLVMTFQGFVRVSDQHVEAQRAILMKLFGTPVLPYFDRCVGTRDQLQRIALGNAAAFDRDALLSYLSTTTVLAGRHNTLFKSAFFVSAPITASDILDVAVSNPYTPASVMYSLDDFFNGRPLAVGLQT